MIQIKIGMKNDFIIFLEYLINSLTEITYSLVTILYTTYTLLILFIFISFTHNMIIYENTISNYIKT